MKTKQLPKRISYYRKPANISTEQWQIILRRQFAQESKFKITNLGTEKIFSDFKVFNPLTANSYKVAIRTLIPEKDGTNFCSCYDFKTNSLGTCKHIEAALIHIRKQKGFRALAAQRYEPTYTSIYLKYGGERGVKIRIGAENKKEFSEFAKKYFDNNLFLRKESYEAFDILLNEASATNSSFKCYQDALEYIIDIREANKRRQIINALERSGKWDDYLSTLLKVKPFPFQSEGIRFACNAGRSLNADEMGLGKTLQAVGAAELMKKEFRIAKALIVCPTSLKYQWKSEIEKFTHSSCTVIEGHLLNRIKLYNEESFYKIASYNVIENDLQHINAYAPDLVIVDEAQRIKNWNTKIAQSVKKIRTPYAIVLTGTPLENKIEELVSIVQFVDPFRMGPLHRLLEKHRIKDENGKVVGYKNLKEIGTVLSDIMVRRLKADVLSQMPERVDKNLFVPMTERQMQMHQEFADVVAKLVSKWRRLGFLDEKDRQRLMINLNMMRMVCNSTYIIDQETRHDTKIGELMCILDNAFQIEGQKAVVFSQWERMTRLVAAELDKRKYRYEYLHGGVPSKDRGALLSNFRENRASRVFLSTDAGGVGLNLQSASLIINLDIPWNPAVLEQRIGRIYRYGQNQNVSIINLVAKDTIEHRMLNVLKFKTSVAQGILDNGEDNVFLGESKFKELMKSVDSIVSPDFTTLKTSESVASEKEIAVEQEMFREEKKKTTSLSIPVLSELSEEKEQQQEPVNGKEASSNAEKQIAELFTAGANFLNTLSQTLAKENSIEGLLSRIVEKDEKSGRSYLKIPIENEETVTNAVNVISGFLKMLK